VVPLITGKPVEAQVNDDNFIVPWFSAKAQQNQVRKRRSGKRGDVGSEGTFFLLHIYLSIVLLFWRGLEDLMAGLGGGVGFNLPAGKSPS